jgi:methyl coenzyme M reductase subunit C
VLENFNGVMAWLEQQIDSEQLHLLHLMNIKQHVVKKRSHQFRQTTLRDFS